jgi:hypothetical protein
MVRQQRVFKYVVRGSLPFPDDMLRYDGLRIRHWNRSEATGERFTVQVEGKKCTPGRWASFGWDVLDWENAIFPLIDDEPMTVESDSYLTMLQMGWRLERRPPVMMPEIPPWMSTSLRGTVSTTYSQLVKVFGPPTSGPSDKVNAEWEMMLDGVPVTIYDYKQDQLPIGEYDWHIGGQDSDRDHLTSPVALVKQALTYGVVS